MADEGGLIIMYVSAFLMSVTGAAAVYFGVEGSAGLAAVNTLACLMNFCSVLFNLKD